MSSSVSRLLAAVAFFSLGIVAALLLLRQSPGTAFASNGKGLSETAVLWASAVHDGAQAPATSAASLLKWWKAGESLQPHLPEDQWVRLEREVLARQWQVKGDADAAIAWVSSESGVAMGFRVSQSLGNVLIIATADGSPAWICPSTGCTIIAKFGGVSRYFKASAPASAQSADPSSVLGIEPFDRVTEGLSLSDEVVWELPSSNPKHATVSISAVGWREALREAYRQQGMAVAP